MIRPTLLALLISTLLVPASHAVGTGTALDSWAPAAPTLAEKKALEQKAAGQRTAEKSATEAKADARAQAREGSETEIKELKRKLAAEEAKRKAAEAHSEDNRRKAEAVAAAKKQAEQKAAESLAAEQAKRQQAEAEQAKRAAESAASAERDRAARAVAAPTAPPGTRLPAYPGGPVLVALKTDGFTMGSVNGETDERPSHPVRVAQPFAMGETEVSFAQWDACVNDTSSALRCTYKPEDRWGRGDQPVMNVSYDDITQQYLPWLNAKTQAKEPFQFRLPTEAEWEYAARAGGKGDYSLGPNNSDMIDSANANYFLSQRIFLGLRAGFRDKTVSVNSFAPNAFGLYNMHGNVWEWTADCYNSEEYQRREKAGGEWPASKTSEEKGGCSRVVRGGSFDDKPVNLRSARRFSASPDKRSDTPAYAIKHIGFRVARTGP